MVRQIDLGRKDVEARDREAVHYAIHDVPAGKYKLVAWNEQGGQTSTMVDVGPVGAANVVLTLDSSNYRAATHMNKVGKPYTAPPRDY